MFNKGIIDKCVGGVKGNSTTKLGAVIPQKGIRRWRICQNPGTERAIWRELPDRNCSLW